MSSNAWTAPAAVALLAVCVAVAFDRKPYPGGAPVLTDEERFAHAKALDAAAREEMNTRARALLDAFRGRVWNPARDAGFTKAELLVKVKQDDVQGRYRVLFDATRALDDQITIERLEEGPGIHPGSMAQAKRFAVVALLGGYQRAVAPFVPLLYFVVKDARGNQDIAVPPFRGSPSTYYKIDHRGILVRRATRRGDEPPVRVRFLWSDWKDRPALLDELEAEGAAHTTYEYEAEGPFLRLRRATLTQPQEPPRKPHVFTAQIDWVKVE